MSEALSIIKTQEGKEMFGKVEAFLENFHQGMTAIQVNRFVLNDVEYPTAYGKYVQAKAELVHRYFQLVDLYYEIEKNKIEMEMERNKGLCHSGLQRDLHELEAKRLSFQLKNRESRVNVILKEAAIFFETYQKHADYDNMTEEQRLVFEWQNWKEKALNMPLVFEERYGDDFMFRVFGPEGYEQFLDQRRKAVGMLPREMAHTVRNLTEALPKTE